MRSRRAEISVIRLAYDVLLRARATTVCCRSGVALCTLLGLAVPGWVSSARAVELASVGLFGAAGNNASSGVGTNSDGTFVAFFSDASNLVPSDTNQARDVFVRDLSADVTERVSVSSTNQQANGPSQSSGGVPAMSGDASVVAFYSDATNLVPNDTNGQSDVFVRVRGAGTTELISVAPDGVTPGNGSSVNPSISADGRFVAFQSLATNLVPGASNNGSAIFVRDRVAQTTELLCNMHGNASSSFPAISGDGNVVAFSSTASNFVAGDTNGVFDIFVCTRSSGVIERVSLTSSGAQGDGDSILPAINTDGSVIGFKSTADNMVAGDTNGVVDVFVRDRTAGTTERITVNFNGGNSDDGSFRPSLSGDGRYVVFGSAATNLVPNDVNRVPDVFVRDRQNQFTVLVDKNSFGEEANGGVPDVAAAISTDGKQIGFVSQGTNLVTTKTHGVGDVFSTLNDFQGPSGCPEGVCPDGQVCVKGFCTVPTGTVPPTRTPTPTRTGPPTASPTPTPTFQVCTDDSQCPDGEHCRGGTCKIERPCDDSNPAIDRHACFDREACIDNLCECGGDCNLDGFVFVNEINKAVKILNNLEPLSQCTAADIDGDGVVMGNEITLAVINLGQGCAQEGQPLIFAHDRGGMVTLTVGAVSGAPGDSVTVPIDLSGGQGQVASAQLDLLFDPTAVNIADPGSACAKDPRLTEHVFSAVFTDSPPPPTGLKRLRLFVGDITPPVATFDDGRIATCTFQVQSNAVGTQSVLAADRLNVGDAHGDVFGSQAVTGGVSILVPTPTPGTVVQHPACPGDCNGDGEVLVNEITVAVRIMAGEVPLSDCPAADADGDGEVFVTDITRAVIALGTGCPE